MTETQTIDERGMPPTTPELPAPYHQRPVSEILDWRWKREAPPVFKLNRRAA